MNFQTLAYDLCRCYVNDHDGLIESAVTNKVLGWIRSRNLRSLTSCSDIIPGAYHDQDLNRFCRQVAAFFKKNAAFSDQAICKPAAEAAFDKAEMLCRVTNKRLDYYYVRRSRMEPGLSSLVDRTEDIIRDVLGDFDVFFESIPSRIRITAGATSTRSRRNSLPFMKIGARNIPATPLAQPYLKALATRLGYRRVSFKTVLENRVETVPKNYKTDRTIACEPEGNLSLQLALDSFIKDCLRKLSVDLSCQSKNQEMSRLASINDDYVTVDLSMASDTISYNAVAWLLPLSWFKFASDIRSPLGRGFNRIIKYAKFSSMGNGATFTIESLIFAAICKACTEQPFAVYGDDIIIHRDDFGKLRKLLSFFGFKLNLEKSFTEGPFRESCGTDWFKGVDVTPFYLRSQNTMKIELCHVVNGMASLSWQGSQLENYLLELIQHNNLPIVPYNESSISGVWVCPSTAYNLKLIRNHNQMLSFKGLIPQNVVIKVADSRTLFLWHLDASRIMGRGSKTESGSFLSFNYDRRLTFSRNAIVRSFPSCIDRSSVPIFTHKYKRKWVFWCIPETATPAHLYGWSDSIFRIMPK